MPQPSRLARQTVACFVLLLGASAASSQTRPPDTPVGRVLEAWLAAVNSIDRGRIRSYIEEYEPGLSYVEQLQLAEVTGGFELSSVEESEPLRIVFFLSERSAGTQRLGKLDVQLRDGKPTVVSRYLWVTPPGSRMLGFDVDAATREAVVRGAAAKLREFHLHPDVGRALAADLEKRLERGEYDQVTDGEVLADLLTKQIQAAGGDTHIGIRFTATVPPEHPPDASVNRERRPSWELLNCFVRQVDVLPNNIGYLKLDGFERPDLCGSTVSAAMTIVQNVDALVIDLRESMGGWESMVAYVDSYLFSEPTHVIDTVTPSTKTVEQHWTVPYVSSKRLNDTPVYLLTSSFTHSGSEIFVDGLKTRGRATVIGERTRGGAQGTTGERIDERFRIFVPTEEAVDPVTKSNWSGKGIAPDVKTSADDALDTALRLIAQRRTL